MAYSLPQDTSSRPVVVIGSGTLGRRVALVWASKGGSVVLVDSNPAAASAALHWIEKELPARARAVNGTPGKVISATDNETAVKGAWMVVECIPEVKDAKVNVLGQLDRVCDGDTIIATISSSYKSSDLIDKVSENGRARVLNTHYFVPPELPPVEVMSSGHTDPSIIDFLIPKMQEIGLDPVIAQKQSTGFVFNRIWAAIKREIMMVLAENVGTPEDIDKMFRYTFQSKGVPCELMDKVGLQTVCNIEDHYIQERGNIPTNPVEYIRQEFVEKGNIGVPSGRGLYDHTKASTKDLSKPSLRSQLIGSWELVDYLAFKEGGGETVYPLGKNAQGIIIYTADGYMSAQLQRPGQIPFKVNDLHGGTPEEWSKAGENYVAYTGPYYVDETGGEPIIQHHMTNCSFPSWLGNTQRRLVKIMEEGGEKYLTLGPESASTIMGEQRITQLKWRRLDDNQASQPS